jgi:hypothetical protein
VIHTNIYTYIYIYVYIYTYVYIYIYAHLHLLYHLNHAYSYSAFLKMGSHAFHSGWTGQQSSYFTLSAFTGMVGVHHHAHTLFSVEIGSHKVFCPDRPGTVILLISASQVGRIIVVSHCTQLYFFKVSVQLFYVISKQLI